MSFVLFCSSRNDCFPRVIVLCCCRSNLYFKHMINDNRVLSDPAPPQRPENYSNPNTQIIVLYFDAVLRIHAFNARLSGEGPGDPSLVCEKQLGKWHSSSCAMAFHSGEEAFFSEKKQGQGKGWSTSNFFPQHLREHPLGIRSRILL